MAHHARERVPLSRNLDGNAKRAASRWTAASDDTVKYDILIDGARRSVELTRPADEPSRLTATIDGRGVEADAVQISPGVYSILLDVRSFEVHVESATDHLLLHTAGHEFRVEIVDPRFWRRGTAESFVLQG